MAFVLGEALDGCTYAEQAVQILQQNPSLQTEVVTLVQCCAVAALYLEQKRFEEAKTILEHTTPKLCEALGETHMSVCYVLRDYAEVCFALGLRQQAKKLFKQAYE